MTKKINIGWGLTNVCNMCCEFCYSKNARKESNLVGITEWKKFVDQNHEKIDSINYGTGENSLIDDFFYFVEYVRKNYPDIKQSVTTNGHIYKKVSSDERFMKIYKDCIDEVDVSLDFCNRDRHNKFRGQKMAYDWAINTLNMLKNDSKKATIVFVGFEETLQKENIDGLFAIAKKYNALLRLNIYRPVARDHNINEKFILSYDTLKSTLDYINERYKIITLSDVLFGNLFTDQTEIKENTGIGSIRILPDGNICPSTYLISKEQRSNYYITDDNVLDKIKFDEFENAKIPNECSNCKYKDSCRGGVFDRRILWYDTLDKRDPYCPILLGKKIPSIKYHITKKTRVSVHEEYLPTMFFSN